MTRVLHVGCGGDTLPGYFGECVETRLDIDPACKPDICAPMTEMGAIGPFDVVYCSHALEHLYPHDVMVALGEFRRVLRPGGVALVVVPDLEGVSPTPDVLFTAPCGDVTGFDLYYGARHMVASNAFMAHRCGFVAETLADCLQSAGFAHVTTERSKFHNLAGAGVKPNDHA